MKPISPIIVILLLCACVAAPPKPTEWPDVAMKRVELERVSLDGRIIVIEHVPRFLTPGVGSYGNMDSRFDHYYFWDFCRGDELVWQMVVLRPDSRARSGWSFTKTVTIPPQKDNPGNTRVTEGVVRNAIAGFADLRIAGLAHFRPGEFRCDASYGDPLST